ncbi:MAG: ABC transporter ATP-binding protein [Lachnospiraceae bacterium]|jgi:ABC-type multidrug transport system fused ATPase/permease subunit|nr:ABC transporter ATP-binding protein [Lachnospiraceae bacterium]MBR4782105.1 ABC transporter ATP-binding protein [Lachnospiraceae bacterium]
MGKLKEAWKDRDNQYKYAKWLMKYSKPYMGRITLMMAFSIISTVVSLWMVQISKNIIDNATGGNKFVTLLIVYFCLMIAMQVVGIVSTLLSAILSEKFSFGIRKQIYDKIIRSHWMDVKRYHTGDLMTRLTSDAGAIADGIIGTIPNIIILFVELLMVFVTLFIYSPLLAVFAMLVAPVAALVSFFLGKKLKKLQIKVQESESNYRSFLQESLANLLVVKSFANEDYSVDRLTTLREERFKWVFKKTKMSIASSTVMSMTFQLGYIVAFAYGAWQISTGQITYGTMTVFLTLVNRVQSPIIGLAQQIPRVVSVLASAGRVIELQNIPVEERLPEVVTSDKIGVDIENLTFGYTDEIVLDNVSLNIKPGEFVAIIGESGIGKTTLLRIIMSFMGNYTGKVDFFDENGLTDPANANTRRFISYVPQGNTLFSGTVRENIRMGKLDATDEEMWDALKLSAGYDFVKELPNGLYTVIGERGHGISEGQAQRIAIARAFVRKAPLLILDEATSALDENTEKEVIKGLQQLEPRPTCIVVTHRKSILTYCDREIKIENKNMEEIQ